MKNLRSAIYSTFAVFFIPIAITYLYKFIETTIGPVVVLYSVVAGVALALIWGITARNKINLTIGVLVGLIVLPIGFVAMLYYFIWITIEMGEMNYNLI